MFRLVFFACFLFFPSILLANDIPPIKEGLWKVEVKEAGKTDQVIKQCINQAVFGELLQAGQKVMGGACKDLAIKNESGVYSAEVRCNVLGSKVVSLSEVKGDFNKSYVAVTKTEMKPPLFGMGNSSQISIGTYQGECTDGMKPGDMIMADGKRMNLIDSINSAPKIGEMMKQMPDLSQVQNVLKKMQGQ